MVWERSRRGFSVDEPVGSRGLLAVGQSSSGNRPKMARILTHALYTVSYKKTDKPFHKDLNK